MQCNHFWIFLIVLEYNESPEFDDEEEEVVKLDVADFRDKNEVAIVSEGDDAVEDDYQEEEDFKEVLNQFTKETPTNHTTKEKDKEEVSDDRGSGTLSGT